MGKALLVHLSDIHVRSNDDPILERADLIAAAVQDMDLGLDAAVIVVTGDLAYSGQEAQYLAVWEFLEAVKDRLAHRLAGPEPGRSVPVAVVAIPGNHDCDFSGPTLIRRLVLENILSDYTQALLPSMVAMCVEVQNQFFESLDAFGSPAEVSINNPVHRLAYRYSVPVGSETIMILCFNSAWMSEIHERQGTLYVPDTLVPADRPEGSVVVAMFHHPYNWFPAEPARAFRQRIEAVADLILTGHEHQATVRTQRMSTGEHNTVIEGGALQEATSLDESVFNAFVLDLTRRKQKTTRFGWDGKRYAPLGRVDSTGNAFGGDWEELHATRLRERTAFEPSNLMWKQIDDLGMPIIHKKRGVLKLSDVFVSPDLQEIIHPETSNVRIIRSAEVANLLRDSPRLVILGDGESGKTSLAKFAFTHLLDHGYIPILLDGKQRPSVGDGFIGYLSNVFESQYSSQACQSYLQLDRSSRVIIVDDYDQVPLKGEKRKQFIQGINQFAGRVILLASGLVHEAHDLLAPGERAEAVVPFAKYRIMPMGKVLRNEFVEKWMLLDDDATFDVARYAYRRDELNGTLDTLTAGNRLPQYPMYVLTILHGTEIIATMDTQVGTHGALYELIIRGALGRDRTPVQFNITIGYLAHLAYRIFDTDQRIIDENQFRVFHRQYEKAMKSKLISVIIFAIWLSSRCWTIMVVTSNSSTNLSST